MASDDELSRLAEEALLREAQRGAQRAEISGPSGWLKCRLPPTNKTFLQNTLLGALAANRVKEKQDKTRCENAKRKRELSEKERNTYKRVYIQASSKPKKAQIIESMKGNSKVINKKTNTDSKQVFVWSEEGLELRSGEGINDQNKSKCKGNTSNTTKVLPRNIKFVPSGNRNIDYEKR